MKNGIAQGSGGLSADVDKSERFVGCLDVLLGGFWLQC